MQRIHTTKDTVSTWTGKDVASFHSIVRGAEIVLAPAPCDRVML